MTELETKIQARVTRATGWKSIVVSLTKESLLVNGECGCLLSYMLPKGMYPGKEVYGRIRNVGIDSDLLTEIHSVSSL